MTIEDPERWVFNRMAEAYGSRPPYPPALIDALVELAGDGRRVIDLGAGIGHLALPLAERGLEVEAVEPAASMLERLRAAARERGLGVSAIHATAESFDAEEGATDLAVIADALHFLDPELVARQLARALAPRAALAIVTCELADTGFMRGVTAVMEECAPRRPRRVDGAIAQLASSLGVGPLRAVSFEDSTPVDASQLEGILRSISFIGPAMSPERFGAFRAKIAALPGPAIWSRSITLRSGTLRSGALRSGALRSDRRG